MKPRVTYRPGHSLLHRLHPLVKVGWLLVGTVAFFVLGEPWVIAILLVLIRQRIH